jgi:hypothetical protein
MIIENISPKTSIENLLSKKQYFIIFRTEFFVIKAIDFLIVNKNLWFQLLEEF